MFDLTCLLSSVMDRKGSSTYRTAGWFLGSDNNPRFCLLLYEQEEILVITDFIQHILVHVHTHAPMLLLLLVGYPQRHKFGGDLPCVQVPL
jgi:hypothetical protein